MSAAITCSKSGCGKIYIGSDFDTIQKDHDLVRKGQFYYCRSCFTKASGKELRQAEKIEKKKHLADTMGVEELYTNEERGK